MFNMITGINKSKTLTKHISYECKCNFYKTKWKSNQLPNNDECQYECIKIHVCEKEYVWNPGTFNRENGKYLASIMDKTICDETIDVKVTNFNEQNITCKTKRFYILIAFVLITIKLVIAVSIFCYLKTEDITFSMML